jgi:deoxycytidylate deaminase
MVTSMQPSTHGPCAKQRVVCRIYLGGEYEHRMYIQGENSCRTPQASCPRAPGEDYTKCKTVCNQEGHAEIMAIKTFERLGTHDPAQAFAKIYGHTRICTDCEKELHRVGIKKVFIEPKLEKGM